MNLQPLQHACTGTDTHYNYNTWTSLQTGSLKFCLVVCTCGVHVSCKIQSNYNMSSHVEAIMCFMTSLSLHLLCVAPSSRQFLMEDAVKVALTVSGTLLPCHTQPPRGGFEGILVLWDVCLSCQQKFSWTGRLVDDFILNSVAR